jgi:glycosyltransferase involved in cell wall biosynthesis
VDVFMPVSREVAERCRLGAGETSRIVPNLFRPAPVAGVAGDSRLAQLPQEPFLLFFGDASEDKGAGLLAQAYATLAQPPPLVFLGRRLSGDLAGRPGVTALGPWPHPLAMEALKRALFVVAPSIWPEPFGFVALEAAAAGKAVVASDIGGLRDTVRDGETGVLVAPGDRQALAAAMRRLIDDPHLRAGMGEAALRRAADFAPERVLPAVEAAYDTAIARRRRRCAEGVA